MCGVGGGGADGSRVHRRWGRGIRMDAPEPLGAAFTHQLLPQLALRPQPKALIGEGRLLWHPCTLPPAPREARGSVLLPLALLPDAQQAVLALDDLRLNDRHEDLVAPFDVRDHAGLNLWDAAAACEYGARNPLCPVDAARGGSPNIRRRMSLASSSED